MINVIFLIIFVIKSHSYINTKHFQQKEKFFINNKTICQFVYKICKKTFLDIFIYLKVKDINGFYFEVSGEELELNDAERTRAYVRFYESHEERYVKSSQKIMTFSCDGIGQFFELSICILIATFLLPRKKCLINFAKMVHQFYKKMINLLTIKNIVYVIILMNLRLIICKYTYRVFPKFGISQISCTVNI